MAPIQYFFNNEQLLLKNQVPIKVTEYELISWPHCMYNLLDFESIFKAFIWLFKYSNNLITVHALCFTDDFKKPHSIKWWQRYPPLSPQHILPQFALVVGQSLSEPTGFTFFLFFECLGFTISSSCNKREMSV